MTSFDALCSHQRELARINAIASLLDWDERCYLPNGAGAYRADQLAYLAGVAHQMAVDPRVGRWLAELEGSELARDRNSDSGTVIRRLRRNYDRATKLPQRLVEELTRARSLGQQTWVEARKNNDFRSFIPILTTIVALRREEVQAIGHAETPYDTLLDDYEPGEKTSQVRQALAGLRDELVPLVRAIQESGRRPRQDLLTRHFPRDMQERFGSEVARAIGFDFERGRLDVTHHPFCTTTGPDDIRITTRYDEHDFANAFFSILHEAGHGLYEQGLRTEWFGLPPGESTSLGIHESQSRMWENLVGRSRAFWERWYPAAQKAFPSALGDVPLDDFYFAVNEVAPSLIRTESDEATYNLHIILRFELEQELLDDRLPIADLPAAWNARYQEYLGITPPNDSDGVLQDVHWSAALIGYFPTYSLGNMYASQFFEQAERELGDLNGQFREGEYRPLREWLREKIHSPGQCYSAAELAERITGAPLSHAPLIRHLRAKFGPLYGI